jgi:hypothetical protein
MVRGRVGRTLAQLVNPKIAPKEDFQSVAKAMVESEDTLKAIMIVNDLGKVLGHARGSGYTIGMESTYSEQPSYLAIPENALSVFMLVSPEADLRLLKGRVAKAIRGTTEVLEEPRVRF